LSRAFDAEITYRLMGVEEYRDDFIGTVVAGIYQGIHRGAYDANSDFEAAASRPHQDWAGYFSAPNTTGPTATPPPR